jgi:hypothetical protein
MSGLWNTNEPGPGKMMVACEGFRDSEAAHHYEATGKCTAIMLFVADPTGIEYASTTLDYRAFAGVMGHR